MASLCLWNRSIQEMGGDVVIGRCIYGVLVIDGLLYSDSTVFFLCVVVISVDLRRFLYEKSDADVRTHTVTRYLPQRQ